MAQGSLKTKFKLQDKFLLLENRGVIIDLDAVKYYFNTKIAHKEFLNLQDEQIKEKPLDMYVCMYVYICICEGTGLANPKSFSKIGRY